VIQQEENMRIILAVVLTAAIAAPAAAQYGPRHSAASEQAKSKAIGRYAQEYRGSRYSSNPAFDVYVNGEYVGSDPDPRIRATLAHEWRTRGGYR
jgi:hypothetical protein